MRSNEDKLELFADILEPAAKILADQKLADLVRSGSPIIAAVRQAIKAHKAEIIEILARFEDVEPKEYKINGVVLTMRIINLFNDPDIRTMADELFTSPLQSVAAASVGNATAATQE